MPTSLDLGWSFKGTLEAILLVFRNLWWVFALAMIEPALQLALNAYKRSQDAKAGLPEIDRMTGERFEEWLAHFFTSRGYSVKLTPRTGDYGVDLLMRRDGQITAVQAKCWKGSVGPKAIQEVYAGKAHYRADAAVVVTNRYYTQEARRLAQSTAVGLWDRERLKKEILSARGLPAAKTAPPKPAADTITRRR